MNQIVLGMSLPFAICAALYLKQRGMLGWRILIGAPLAMLAGGAWAIVPDFPRLWGDLVWYTDLHHHPHCWIWFNHCHIDRNETDSPLWIALFLAMTCSALAAVWREIARSERHTL